jgi:ATP-dependent helicase/nuclease subunit A
MRYSGTTEQDTRDYIVNHFDESFFVEAGAGAGKTSIIVSRIVNQLKSGWTTPERIVAITFTNAATRELKTRILIEVEKASKYSNLKQEERDNLTKALKNIDNMQVSTIHGLCHRLLIEKSFDVGLPMDFDLMDEKDVNKLFDSFFVKWSEKNLKYAEWNALKPANNGARWKALPMLKAMARSISELAPDVSVEIENANADQNKADADIAMHLGNIVAQLDAVAPYIPLGRYSGFSSVDEEYLNAEGKTLQKHIKQGDILSILEDLAGVVVAKGKVYKVTKTAVAEYYLNNNPGMTKAAAGRAADTVINDIKTHEEVAFSLIRSLKDTLEDLIAIKQVALYGPYVELAKKAATAFREEFPAGIMTNDLLLQKTYELLDKNPEVRAFFGEKFDCFYVDEFQDTDHIQDSFIKLLAEKPGESGTLRDGALFVVGDPKQSIYRFRGAEPEVYFDTRDWMEKLGNAKVCMLSYNFRSDSTIIDWVNAEFAPKPITGNDPYSPMTAAKAVSAAVKSSNTLIKGVYKYASPLEPIDKGAIGLDSDAVCRLINGMVNNGYQIEDAKTRQPRNIQYSDFLVLCARRNGMSAYAKTMMEYGIPFIMSGKTEPGKNYYINALIRLYAYLADSYDNRARMGALEALYESGAADKDKNRKLLETLRDRTKEMSAYGALEYLLNNRELLLHKDKKLNGYGVDDLQKKLIQMTEFVLTNDHDSREDVLASMQSYAGKELEREVILEENANAVRFMNLHKAKGLEGNIIIWTNRKENMTFKKGSYRLKKTYYPGIEVEVNGQKANIWSAHKANRALCAQALQEYEEEKIRLEYVAATRAGEALIFMDNFSKNSLFIDGFDLNGLPDVMQMAVGTKSSNAGSPTTIDEQRIEQKAILDNTYSESFGKDVFSSESPSDYENGSAGRSRKKTDTGSGEGPEEDATQDGTEPGSAEEAQGAAETQGATKTENDHGAGVSERRPVGNIFGTVMHRSLELFVERHKMAAPVPSIDPVDMCIKQALDESDDDISDDQTAQYREFLTDVLKAYKKWFEQPDSIVAKAAEMHTELPFSYMMTGQDGESVWMHGEADLVLKLNDGRYYVIDYKSDDDRRFDNENEFAEILKKRYCPQIAAYKRAISALFGVPEDSIGAALISFSEKDVTAGEKIRVRVTEITDDDID